MIHLRGAMVLSWGQASRLGDQRSAGSSRLICTAPSKWKNYPRQAAHEPNSAPVRGRATRRNGLFSLASLSVPETASQSHAVAPDIGSIAGWLLADPAARSLGGLPAAMFSGNGKGHWGLERSPAHDGTSWHTIGVLAILKRIRREEKTGGDDSSTDENEGFTKCQRVLIRVPLSGEGAELRLFDP